MPRLWHGLSYRCCALSNTMSSPSPPTTEPSSPTTNISQNCSIPRSISLTRTPRGKRDLSRTPTSLSGNISPKTPISPHFQMTTSSLFRPNLTFDPENIWTFLPRNKNSCYLCTTVLHFEVESIHLCLTTATQYFVWPSRYYHGHYTSTLLPH